MGVPDISWKKIRFDISKSTVLALSGFKIFENGVDITPLGSFQTNCNESGCSAGSAIFVAGNARTISASNATYTLQATVTGVSGTGLKLTTSVFNPMGTGVWVSGAYAQMAAGIGTIIWTDHTNLGETSPFWFTDRNIKYLPFYRTLSTNP